MILCYNDYQQANQNASRFVTVRNIGRGSKNALEVYIEGTRSPPTIKGVAGVSVQPTTWPTGKHLMLEPCPMKQILGR